MKWHTICKGVDDEIEPIYYTLPKWVVKVLDDGLLYWHFLCHKRVWITLELPRINKISRLLYAYFIGRTNLTITINMNILRNLFFNIAYQTGVSKPFRWTLAKNNDLVILSFHRVSDNVDQMWPPMPIKSSATVTSSSSHPPPTLAS